MEMQIFDPSLEDFPTYLERLEIFMIAKGTKEARKVAILLNYIGRETYATLRNLLVPTKPIDKPYDELVQTLQQHFNPAPNPTAERFKFSSRTQNSNESV